MYIVMIKMADEDKHLYIARLAEKRGSDSAAWEVGDVSPLSPEMHLARSTFMLMLNL